MSSDGLEKHIRWAFRDFEKKVEFFLSATRRKERLKQWYAKKRAITRAIEKLVGKKKRVLVGYGSAAVGSCRKGSAPIPAKEFLRELKRRNNVGVVMIDEYLTSQVCNKCKGKEMENKKRKRKGEEKEDQEEEKGRKGKKRSRTSNRRRRSTRIWGVKVCKKCLTTWNRDRNGSLNILDILLHMLEHKGKRPNEFRRQKGPTRPKRRRKKRSRGRRKYRVHFPPSPSHLK
jgi:RNase H-fold protein (predicted Holliday junction resolvase)